MGRAVAPADVFALRGMTPGVISDGPLLFISGQIALDEEGRVVGEGDFPRQVEQVMTNLRRVLHAGGADFTTVLKIGVFLADRQYLAEWRELREAYFSHPFPASTLVMAELVLPSLLIEIEAIAELRRVTQEPALPLE